MILTHPHRIQQWAVRRQFYGVQSYMIPDFGVYGIVLLYKGIKIG